MITREDCIAFCDATPHMVERVMKSEQLPELPAIACAHSRTVSANEAYSRLPLDAFKLVALRIMQARLAA